MTDLAYMIRNDWAQHSTAMEPSSARIREWLGRGAILFAVPDVGAFADGRRDADLETAQYITPDLTMHNVINIADLRQLRESDQFERMAVLHPYELRDCEALSNTVRSGLLGRIFVQLWSPTDMIRCWLDANGAIDLHTGQVRPAPDPLMVAAAELMVDEQYNGLSSGRGKDAVVQLLRAYVGEGHTLEADPWLRAFFAAGGAFRHAESLKKLIREARSGVNHRVKPRYRPDILDILRERVSTIAGLKSS